MPVRADKPKILRTDKHLYILERELEQLKKTADVVTATSDDEETLVREAQDVELILTCYDQITTKVIETAKNLKGIVKYGVGVNNIDVKTATRRGVMVVNCPAYGTDTVADHAFALMISLARKINKIDHDFREKTWMWPSTEYLGFDLTGKTIGFIGLGKIGKAMARRAHGFGMKKVAYDPYAKNASELDIQMVDLDQLLELSDFISIHCVLTSETQGLIGEKEIKKMKRKPFIINVSRAAIIEEDALIKALKEDQIAGAGLDVYHHEPLDSNDPLLNMDNVVLSPHLAWYTHEAFKRCEKQTLQSILDIFEGRIPKNLKNTEVLDHLGQFVDIS